MCVGVCVGFLFVSLKEGLLEEREWSVCVCVSVCLNFLYRTLLLLYNSAPLCVCVCVIYKYNMYNQNHLFYRVWPERPMPCTVPFLSHFRNATENVAHET